MPVTGPHLVELFNIFRIIGLQQLGRADLVGVLAPLLDVVARADGDGLGADHGGAARQPRRG